MLQKLLFLLTVLRSFLFFILLFVNIAVIFFQAPKNFVEPLKSQNLLQRWQKRRVMSNTRADRRL
jgi:hypothetical protein